MDLYRYVLTLSIAVAMSLTAEAEPIKNDDLSRANTTLRETRAPPVVEAYGPSKSVPADEGCLEVAIENRRFYANRSGDVLVLMSQSFLGVRNRCDSSKRLSVEEFPLLVGCHKGRMRVLARPNKHLGKAFVTLNEQGQIILPLYQYRDSHGDTSCDRSDGATVDAPVVLQTERVRQAAEAEKNRVEINVRVLMDPALVVSRDIATEFLWRPNSQRPNPVYPTPRCIAESGAPPRACVKARTLSPAVGDDAGLVRMEVRNDCREDIYLSRWGDTGESGGAGKLRYVAQPSGYSSLLASTRATPFAVLAASTTAVFELDVFKNSTGVREISEWSYWPMSLWLAAASLPGDGTSAFECSQIMFPISK
jgi:hypothetical protein